MQLRHFSVPLIAAAFAAGVPFGASAASPNACSIVTKADVAFAVGPGTISPGKPQPQHAGDPTTSCQYDSPAGNVVVTFDPTNYNQYLSRAKAGYGSSLKTVPAMGDEALYNQEHGTLWIRKGKSVLMLTLDTPDQARGHAVLFSLAHRVVPRLH